MKATVEAETKGNFANSILAWTFSAEGRLGLFSCQRPAQYRLHRGGWLLLLCDFKPAASIAQILDNPKKKKSMADADMSVMSASDLTSIGFDSTVDADAAEIISEPPGRGVAGGGGAQGGAERRVNGGAGGGGVGIICSRIFFCVFGSVHTGVAVVAAFSRFGPISSHDLRPKHRTPK